MQEYEVGLYQEQPHKAVTVKAVSEAAAAAKAASDNPGWRIEYVDDLTAMGCCEGCGIQLFDIDRYSIDEDGIMVCRSCDSETSPV